MNFAWWRLTIVDLYLDLHYTSVESEQTFVDIEKVLAGLNRYWLILHGDLWILNRYLLILHRKLQILNWYLLLLHRNLWISNREILISASLLLLTELFTFMIIFHVTILDIDLGLLLLPLLIWISLSSSGLILVTASG